MKKNLISNSIEKFSHGYTIIPNSIKTSFKKKFKLSALDILVFEHLISTNKTEFLQSARKIAEIINEPKTNVVASLKKLIKLNLVDENKVTVHYSIFKAIIPYDFKSKYSTDSATGKKDNVNMIPDHIKIKNVTIKLAGNGPVRLLSWPVMGQLNKKLAGNGPTVTQKVKLRESEFKKKVKLENKQSSFKNETEIREELMHRYQCTSDELDMAFNYKVKHDNIETPHLLFYKRVKSGEFKIILEKASKEATLTAENNNILQFKTVPKVDLSYIHQLIENWQTEAFENDTTNVTEDVLNDAMKELREKLECASE